MKKEKKCSIIIRTNNEERWITPCLKAVFAQEYTNFDVIIVDNDSVDKTVEKAKHFPIKRVVKIENYLPGKALNEGIRNSDSEYIVCLSAHCIPVNNQWLGCLVSTLNENDNFAGVYGRQQPMSFSTAADKRDMLIIFGLDRRVQSKDSFFHNANSILRRKLWNDVPFDDELTNVEDRVWGQEIINRGLNLVYEPSASVYHYHGIHQNNNQERLVNVMQIIDKKGINSFSGSIDATSLNIIALVPISRHRKRKSGKDWLINGKQQYSYTIEAAKKTKYISQIIVSTDDKEVSIIAEKLGAKCPFIRPPELSEAWVNLEIVQKYSLDKIEELDIYPDIIVHLEETFPFRTPELIDDMIDHLLKEGYDSVIAARPESGFLWQEDESGNYIRLDSGDVPRQFKERSFIGLHGLGVVTHPEFIRQEKLLGNRVGLYVIDKPLAGFEVRDKQSRKIANTLIEYL